MITEEEIEQRFKEVSRSIDSINEELYEKIIPSQVLQEETE